MSSETEAKEAEEKNIATTVDSNSDKEKDIEVTHNIIETAKCTSIVGNKDTKNEVKTLAEKGMEENAVYETPGQDGSKELIMEVKGEISDSATVKSVADKIKNEIEANIENEEGKETIKYDENDNKGKATNDHSAIVEEMSIEKGRVPVLEPEFVQEHIEPLGSIQDVKDDIVDAAKLITQKVIEKIENKIEEKVQEEESKEIIDAEDKCSKYIGSSFGTELDKKVEGTQFKDEKCEQNDIKRDMIPVLEPEFVQEHIEPLGSIHDGFIDAAKSITQKVVNKIENKIEQRIAEEESKDFKDDEKSMHKGNAFPDAPEPGTKADNFKPFEPKMADSKIPVDEPLFNKANVENVESIKDVKEDIVEAAKSVVKHVITKIDNEITNKVEMAEKSEIMNDPVNEPGFKEVKIEPVLQSVMNTTELKEDVVANKTKSEDIDTRFEHEFTNDTDMIDKLKAPSFTQLRAESVKEDITEEQMKKTVTEEEAVVVHDVNAEDYYWITVGSFAFAILAIVSSIIYYYFQ